MDYNNQKKMLLMELIKYKRKGHQLSQRYDMSSDFDAMQFELEMIKRKNKKDEKMMWLEKLVDMTKQFKDYKVEQAKYQSNRESSNPFKDLFDKNEEKTKEDQGPDQELEEKKEILKKLNMLRFERYNAPDGSDSGSIPDIYTINDNVEDLRLRLTRFTKLYKKGLSPDDYDSRSVFAEFNQKKQKKKGRKVHNFS